MGSFAKHMILCHANMAVHHRRNRCPSPSPIASSHEDQSLYAAAEQSQTTKRRGILMGGITLVPLASGLSIMAESAKAQNWGTHSFIKEKYFLEKLSPEEAAERIRQTAEGMKDMRPMLDRMSWRYVLFYIRQKSAYLDSDLKNAMATVPDPRRKTYAKAANELVDSMRELDSYVRTPKIYESYLYYEKALKSLDELVDILA